MNKMSVRERIEMYWKFFFEKAAKTPKLPDTVFFFSGDTGYFKGFKEIGEKYGPFDVTSLECGAYNERWSNILCELYPQFFSFCSVNCR